MSYDSQGCCVYSLHYDTFCQRCVQKHLRCSIFVVLLFWPFIGMPLLSVELGHIAQQFSQQACLSVLTTSIFFMKAILYHSPNCVICLRDAFLWDRVSNLFFLIGGDLLANIQFSPLCILSTWVQFVVNFKRLYFLDYSTDLPQICWKHSSICVGKCSKATAMHKICSDAFRGRTSYFTDQCLQPADQCLQPSGRRWRTATWQAGAAFVAVLQRTSRI